MDGFVEVKPIKSCLEARRNYIQSLVTNKEQSPYKENLDPEFELQPFTTLDVLFFEIPDEIKKGITFKLSSNIVGTIFYI